MRFVRSIAVEVEAAPVKITLDLPRKEACALRFAIEEVLRRRVLEVDSEGTQILCEIATKLLDVS